jgi:hypothetical protein
MEPDEKQMLIAMNETVKRMDKRLEEHCKDQTTDRLSLEGRITRLETLGSLLGAALAILDAATIALTIVLKAIK